MKFLVRCGKWLVQWLRYGVGCGGVATGAASTSTTGSEDRRP